VFEMDSFAKGTKAVMDAVIQATKKGAVTIIGMLGKLTISGIVMYILRNR